MSAGFELQPPSTGEPRRSVLDQWMAEVRHRFGWFGFVVTILVGGGVAGIWTIAQRLLLHDQSHHAMAVAAQQIPVMARNIGVLCKRSGVICEESDAKQAIAPEPSPVVPTAMRE